MPLSQDDVAGWIQIAVIAAVFLFIVSHGDEKTSDPGFCVEHQKPMQWRGWYPGEKKSFCDECEWKKMQADDEENR